jgi:hypothetical protein
MMVVQTTLSIVLVADIHVIDGCGVREIAIHRAATTERHT